MKKTRFLSMTAAILAVLLIATAAASCGGTGDGESTTPDTTVQTTDDGTNAPDETEAPDVTDAPADTEEPTQPAEETYTVKFMDGDKVILAVEGKSGDLIDIPADPTNENAKLTFIGWEGMDEADYAAGKVEIFKEDLTFTAKWAQQFGTENVYTATRLGSGDTIAVDGDKDEAYNDATAIEIDTAVVGTPGATAKAYIMWDTTHYYLFVEVTDATVFPYAGGNTDSTDAVEFRMDLLHSDALVPGYSGNGWGGVYRGNEGPMVEAGFKIGAGVTLPDGQRFGNGSEAYWEWWSHHIDVEGNDGIVGVSKVTETGYTVEYKLEIFDAYTDELYRPHEGQVIGFGIRIFDKTAEGGSGTDNKLVLETINDGMDGDARNLSNIKLVANPNP